MAILCNYVNKYEVISVRVWAGPGVGVPPGGALIPGLEGLPNMDEK